MNKYNNPRLLNTVVSGTGMKNPVRPHVIIGSEENGFIRGDLMDANAVKEAVEKEVAERIDADLNLSEEIDTKVRQAVDDLVDGAPEVLDTLKELSEALGDDANFATTITEEIASKVDKVEGKGLSTNDYTTAEKQKLAGIAAGAEVNVQSDWSLTNSSNDSFIKNKPTKLSLFTNDVPYVTEAGLLTVRDGIDARFSSVEDGLADIQSDIDDLKEEVVFTETTDPANGHEYVDLGLPSGTKWATMNVGASSATDYGNYYMYGMGSKTYDSTDTPYSGTEDPLALSADTAAQEWGGDWHMPTLAQMQELTANTTYQWVTNYKGSGINGGTFTATNGAVLFIPAAGHWGDGSQYNVGNYGRYWGSLPNGSNNAFCLNFGNGSKNTSNGGRKYGYPVRGVLDKDTQGETITTPVKEVVTDLKSNEDVIAAALNNLNTKIEATNLRIETFENVTFEDFKGSINEEVELFTKFTPNTVGVDDAAGVFNYNVNQLQELVTNNNTEMLLTTTRNNKKLIVGTIRFFTDNFAHQVTAIATSNIHLDEWDKESSLSGVSHTDGKAYTYVCFCGLNDPAAYSGLQEGVWTDWKKLYPTMDDLDEAVNTLKNRQYMDSSTFDAIFTEADSDAIDYIIDNFAPTFYVKGPSDNVTTCSIVRSATAVCVTRNKVDNTTYTFINECRRGTIRSSGSINWSGWTTISSTVTSAPAA